MITTFSVSWHESRDRQEPSPAAPIPFRGLSIEVHSGDAFDDIELIWQPNELTRSYLDPGDLAEIHEVITQALAHYNKVYKFPAAALDSITLENA